MRPPAAVDGSPVDRPAPPKAILMLASTPARGDRFETISLTLDEPPDCMVTP